MKKEEQGTQKAESSFALQIPLEMNEGLQEQKIYNPERKTNLTKEDTVAGWRKGRKEGREIRNTGMWRAFCAEQDTAWVCVLQANECIM